ncbi:glucose-1-phosphate cytidylyltransferase [Bacillus sp. Marseille-P3661]|uniref:glucose-1-phosphate cytidylyltransferase n=1 Tax=Bacillus sp. Marseille-P3661 TaxID=1936234 RepID=UPI000C821797|nr:glucose-1-phosphate cytidylyltransferase [Bacillus sp. Marseille-P3661]
MKVVILAGGLGTRISEESHLKPKPMIEIGGKPILWHIMKIYSHYGFNEFIICLGYKGYAIKEYFANYHLNHSDVTFDFSQTPIKTTIHSYCAEPWKVTLVDTGNETLTGGRLKRIERLIGNETFMMTYGDGLSNINIDNLLDYHYKSKKIATVTAVQPEGRFGSLDIEENGVVKGFLEKPKGDGNWVNGGFFVLSSEVFNYIDGDSTVFEREPLQQLADKGELAAYKHSGFWFPMDTLRDKNNLEEMWKKGSHPWKIWN